MIIVDDIKLSPQLGTHWALPVEALEFGRRSQQRFLESLGAVVTPGMSADDLLFRTNQGNIILDSGFGPVTDLTGLAAQPGARAGIVEHGLFIGFAPVG